MLIPGKINETKFRDIIKGSIFIHSLCLHVFSCPCVACCIIHCRFIWQNISQLEGHIFLLFCLSLTLEFCLFCDIFPKVKKELLCSKLQVYLIKLIQSLPVGLFNHLSQDSKWWQPTKKYKRKMEHICVYSVCFPWQWQSKCIAYSLHRCLSKLLEQGYNITAQITITPMSVCQKSQTILQFTSVIFIFSLPRNMNPGNKPVLRGKIYDSLLQVWYWILDRKYSYSYFVLSICHVVCLHSNELWWSVGGVLEVIYRHSVFLISALDWTVSDIRKDE